MRLAFVLGGFALLLAMWTCVTLAGPRWLVGGPHWLAWLGYEIPPTMAFWLGFVAFLLGIAGWSRSLTKPARYGVLWSLVGLYFGLLAVCAAAFAALVHAIASIGC
jgi:hypothetical protein